MKKIIFLLLLPFLISCDDSKETRQLIPPLQDVFNNNAELLKKITAQVDKNPTSQNLYLRARLLYQNNQLIESLNDINSSIKIDNTEPKFFLLRAKINFGLKKTNAAIRDAENAELQQLKSPELYTFLSELYIYKRQYKRSLSEINKCLEIAPYQSSAWLWKGIATLKIGDTTDGIDFIKKSIDNGPGTQSFYQLGKVYNKLKDYSLARKYITAGLKYDTLEPNLIYELAENYRFTGKADTSRYLYLKSVSINPGLYKGYFEIGRMYFNKKNYEQAIIYFEKIPENQDIPVQMYELLALSYDFTGKVQKAYDLYGEVIKQDILKNGDTTNFKAIERHWELKKLIFALKYQYQLDSIRLSGQGSFLKQ